MKRHIATAMARIRQICRRAGRLISRHMSYFLVVLLLCGVGACASTTGIKEILRGQTRQEVLAILGPPTTIRPPLAPFIGTELWIWASPTPDGRVEKKIITWAKNDKVMGGYIFFTPAPTAPR